MPLVQVKGVSGYLSKDQKAELIRRLTDAVLSVEGEGLRPVTWVIIEDVPDGQWGVGGNLASAQMLREMAGSHQCEAGKSACTHTQERVTK